MIDRAEAMHQLRDACPSFSARFVEVPDLGGGVGEMAEVSGLARHLVELAGRGEADELPQVFTVVEHLLADGGADVVSLVRTCLVEDIQNITSHRDVPVAGASFRDLLGPLGSEVWDELDESWVASVTDLHARRQRPLASDFVDLEPEARRRMQSEMRELPDGTLARPSDVLRYETDRYGVALDGRRSRIRRYLVALLVIALVFLAISVIASS